MTHSRTCSAMVLAAGKGTRMRSSRPFFAQPEPVGAFATDRSPYGVQDLAGYRTRWRELQRKIGTTLERTLAEPH